MFAALAVVALLTVQDPPTAADMDGAWSVDLATDPAQPYRQPMNLTLQPDGVVTGDFYNCLLYTSPSPRDKRQSRMPSSA